VLRTNLSTRPFYNERAVHLLLVLGALIVALLTAFNAIRILSLSRQNTELSSLIDRDHQEAERLTREAQRIRAAINPTDLEATAESAALANSLIDQRTFSWTEFFNRIEETLPANVMLSAVRPNFSGNKITINMTVLARRTEDIDQFIEQLEATGAFNDVLPAQQDTTADGLHRLLLETVYTGGTPPPATVPADSSGPPAVRKPPGPTVKPAVGAHSGRAAGRRAAR
jgi:Tfp pilus assembly protein PilN